MYKTVTVFNEQHNNYMRQNSLPVLICKLIGANYLSKFYQIKNKVKQVIKQILASDQPCTNQDFLRRVSQHPITKSEAEFFMVLVAVRVQYMS